MPTPKDKYVGSKQKTELKAVGIILIVAILALAAVAVLLVGQGPSKQATPQTQAPSGGTEPETNGSATAPTETDYYLRAIQDGDYMLCMQVTDAAKKGQCIEYFSKTRIEACRLVENLSVKVDCINQFAQAEKKISTCNSLPEKEARACIIKVDACYFRNESDKPLCYALATNDSSRCNGEASCVTTFAFQKKADVCDAISDRVNMYACKQIFDPSACDQLPVVSERDYCKSIYSMQANDLKYCLDISENSNTYMASCITYFAYKNSDPQLCKHLFVLNQGDCYINYAAKHNDPNDCLYIDETSALTRSKCFGQVAYVNNNPSACTYMMTYVRNLDANDPKICYAACFERASKEGQVIKPENCDYIGDYTWKDKCYTWSAYTNKNESICQNIKGDSEKQYCINKLKGTTSQ
ncbi:MAG: hypothetical protein ACP5NX_00445 [Candidatus Bilamarchaeaceae archaeon]